MIDYITGKPRTGKSYRGMKYILDNFFDESKIPPYRYILTNIGGFQFDYLNKKFESIGRPNRAYKIIYKELLSHVTVMHKMALDGKEDSELTKYADYHHINNSLIVIDEAMLYLKKLDEAMSWFFSYHGHFKIRMIIMCQHPKQVHADYKIHTEFFVHAQDQSKQLRDNVLNYKHYDNPELKDSHHSDSIKTNPEVYKLYKSGEIDKPKKILYKYIFYGVVFSFLVFFVFYSLFSRISHSPNSPDKNNLSIENKAPNQNNSSGLNNKNSSDLISIRCDDQFCWNIDKSFENNQISLTYFKYIVVKNDLQLEYSEITNSIYELSYAKKGYEKHLLAYFTDYHYFISDDVRKSYLSTLFIPLQIDRPNNSLFNGKEQANGVTSVLARNE